MITPEDISVARELLVEDVYHAATIFSPHDRWLDVGCHAGYFSLLALMHGASVAGGVDADVVRVNEYVYAQPLLCVLSTDDDLRTLVETTDANAVKLDIQGEELFLLEGLSIPVNKLVVEWHRPELVVDLFEALSEMGYRIIYCDLATDILTHQDTYIVYAERRT